MDVLKFVSKGSHSSGKNLNSIYVSSLHQLLTAQMQWEETLPMKVTSCPSMHRCKVSHPTDLMVLFVHYMSTREQNLLLYDLSVHSASTERR